MITRLGGTQPLRTLSGARYLASTPYAPASSSASTSRPPRNPPVEISGSSTAPTHHFITLLRSTIGLEEKYKGTVKALGLKRRHSVALHPFSKDIAGMILRVKELISVRNVTLSEGEELVRKRKDRSEGAGVEETGLAFGGGRKNESQARR